MTWVAPTTWGQLLWAGWLGGFENRISSGESDCPPLNLAGSGFRLTPQSKLLSVRGRKSLYSVVERGTISTAHEGDGVPINGAVQRQFRLRTEAGHDAISGDGEGSHIPAIRRDVIQKDGGCDAEAAVGVCVVPEIMAIEQIRLLAVIAGGAARNCHGSGAVRRGGNVDR